MWMVNYLELITSIPSGPQFTHLLLAASSMISTQMSSTVTKSQSIRASLGCWKRRHSFHPIIGFILFHFFKHRPACWHSKMRCCAKHIGFPNRSTIHSLWAPLVNLFYFIYLRPVGSGRNGNPPTLASGILNDSWWDSIHLFCEVADSPATNIQYTINDASDGKAQLTLLKTFNTTTNRLFSLDKSFMERRYQIFTIFIYIKVAGMQFFLVKFWVQMNYVCFA